MAQVRVPLYGEGAGMIAPLLRELSNESNDQDNRLKAIEEAIARIDAALAHFSKKEGE